MKKKSPLKPDRGLPYLTFTNDIDKELARKRFIEKYGQDPKFTFIDGLLLKVGPVPK